MGVYADAVAAGENLYFEVSNTVRATGGSSEVLETIARRIRQIGMDRFLFGSDGPDLGGLELRDIWPQFKARVPLSEAELRTIANNVAPFLREGR